METLTPLNKGRRVEARTPPEKEKGKKMKLNPTKALSVDDTRKNPPVLLAVTPPRTGERTLLGVENLLQSIAAPEPFSLELAGDADGVTLMARCLDDQIVRQQISSHYPQARIQQVIPEGDPLRLGEGELAWSLNLAPEGPEYAPLRVFRDDDLLDPGSDPIIALLGALSNLNEGERVVARLKLRSLGPDWSATPHEGDGPGDGGGEDGRHARPPGGGKPCERDRHGRPRPGGPGDHEGLHVGAGRRDLEGGPPGDWSRLRPGRSRLGLAALEGIAFAHLRPAAGEGEGLPHSLRRGGRGGRRSAGGCAECSAPRSCWARSRPRISHYDNPAGARIKVGRARPIAPDPSILHPAGSGLFSRRSILGVREVAAMWHPPGERDETPFVQRSGSRILLPSARSVRGGAYVGDTSSETPGRIHFPEDLLSRRHHVCTWPARAWASPR